MIPDMGTSPILVATTEMPTLGTIAETIELEQTGSEDMRIDTIGMKKWALNVKTLVLSP